MDALQWILLFIGVVIIAAVYLYTKRQHHNGGTGAGVHHVRHDILAGPVDELDIAADSGPRLPGAGEGVILALNIRARDGDEEWHGDKILRHAIAAGLQCGDKGVFEYHAEKPQGEAKARVPVFYVANFVNPGTFDWEHIAQFRTRGLSLFTRLPVPCPAVEAFEKMLECGRYLAGRLGAEMFDDKQNPLTDENLEKMSAVCRDCDARPRR